ncbi:response regulator transcription factor [Virgibacillus kimchii]
MSEYKILTVEDEYALRDMVRMYLEKKGYSVISTADGRKVLSLMEAHEPDLILLDIEMPGIDGFEVCRQVRKNSDIPIIFISVRRETIDKIKSLELGGDDYLTKPFEFGELEARIKALLRRTGRGIDTSHQLVFGDLRLDVKRYQCFLKEEEIRLSKKEMELLLLLAGNPNRVWSSEDLYDRVWGIDSMGNVETVKVHISMLRRKIEPDPDGPKYIKTIRGFGYTFRE